MKRLLLIFCIAIFPALCMNADVHAYIPMLEMDKEWCYAVQDHSNSVCPNYKGDVQDIAYRIDGIELIDGEEWYTMHVYKNGNVEPEEESPICYVREDCDQRKVFFRLKSMYSYDFGYHKTFDTDEFEERTWDFANSKIMIDGCDFDQMTPTSETYYALDGLHHGFDLGGGCLFEGIGFMRQLPEDWNYGPEPIYYTLFEGCPNPSSMCKGYLPLFYSLRNGAGEEIVSIPENSPETVSLRSVRIGEENAKVEIVDGEIVICGQSMLGDIKVYDTAGRLAYRASTNSSATIINTYTFAPGIYIVNVAGSAKQVVIK